MLCLLESTSVNFERGVGEIFVIILKFIFWLQQLTVEQLQKIEIK